MPVSTSKPAPGQLVPPAVLPMLIEPSSFDSGPVGGTYGDCSQRKNLRFASACLRSSGVKSMRSLSRMKMRAYGTGLVTKGCVGDVCSCFNVVWGTGRSSIGQIGTPVTRSKQYSQPCFDGEHTVLRGLPSIVASISSGADDMSW